MPSDKWADAFIAVRIDKIPIREYAAAIANPGEDIAKVENNLTQKLKRATSALAKAYPGKDF